MDRQTAQTYFSGEAKTPAFESISEDDDGADGADDQIEQLVTKCLDHYRWL